MILKPRCLAGRSPCDSSTKASSASAEKPFWKVLFFRFELVSHDHSAESHREGFKGM